MSEPQVQIPDIERAAATILGRVRRDINHPVVAAWVARIIADPDYTDMLDAFWPAAEQPMPTMVTNEDDPSVTSYVPRVPVRGVYGEDNWGDLIQNGWAYPRLPEGAPRTEDITWLVLTQDLRAVYWLATSLVLWRRSGRPAGDQTSHFHDGFTLTTSLAAAVADFAVNYAAASAGQAARLEEELLSHVPDARWYALSHAPYAAHADTLGWLRPDEDDE